MKEKSDKILKLEEIIFFLRIRRKCDKVTADEIQK